MKKIIFLIVFLPFVILAQTTTENYTKATTYKVPTTASITNPTNVQALQQVTYFDGLGRPKQQLANQQSGSGKNIVTPIEYDAFGRQVKDYLPYATTTNSLEYVSTATSDIMTFYNSTYSTLTGNPALTTTNPYSEKLLEASPLDRVVKQSDPGNDWAMGANHEIKLNYQTNTAGEVKLFKALASYNSATGLYTNNLTNPSSYDANQLYKTVNIDEDWIIYAGNSHTSQEFKDKEGHIILKRQFSGLDSYDTFYIYDQYGNLSYVLPPLANGAIDQNTLDGLCYQYQYDYRNRLGAKKLPGKQWEFIIYDKLDRVIATGPTFSPFGDSPVGSEIGWLITKYDVFDRPIYTGWEQSTTVTFAGRKLKQDATNLLTSFSERKTATATIDGIPNVFYSNAIIPTTFKLLTVNYYDNYDFETFMPSIVYTADGYNNTTQKPKGLPTGSWTRVLSTLAATDAERNYVLYDFKARPVKTFSLNYLGGYTQVDTSLDFAGKTIYTETRHKRINADTELYVRDDYSYTPQDRMLAHYHKIGTAGTPQLIAENSYDELGQLISKKVGHNSTNPLQKVDYGYNIRGWLTDINKTGWNDNTNPTPLNITGEPNDLFALRINYNQVRNETGYTGRAEFDGNISETYWRTSGDNVLRKYGYFYDELNRLQLSVYQKPFAATAVTNSYNESMTYDKNGNIKTLQRNGDLDGSTLSIPIDDLNYTYKLNASGNETNQLMRVNDASNSTSGFKDGTNTDDDYNYDMNGNMTIDKNKLITTNIKYNHLNLPTAL